MTGAPDSKRAPHQFNSCMVHQCFENTFKALTHLLDDLPPHQDRFWEVRGLLDAWSENMLENFIPGWKSVLDESMSVWTNMHTCPGFMFVHRKPHSFGNVTQCASASPVFRVAWNWWKEKTFLRNGPSWSSTTLERLLDFCLALQKPCGAQVNVTFQTAASVL